MHRITSASGTFYVCWMHSHFGIGDTHSRREIRLSTSRATESAFRCDAANMCIRLRFWTMCEELKSAPEHTVRSYLQSIGQYSCPHSFHDGMRHGMRTDKQLYSNSNFQFFGFAIAARRFCGILVQTSNICSMNGFVQKRTMATVRRSHKLLSTNVNATANVEFGQWVRVIFVIVVVGKRGKRDLGHAKKIWSRFIAKRNADVGRNNEYFLSQHPTANLNAFE